MDSEKFHIRVVMLFFFRKGENASKTCKNICEVYGDDAIGESTVQRWFVQFKTGNFSLEDKHRSGRPPELDKDVLAAKIEERQDITVRELAEELKLSKSTVHEHLVSLGYTSRYNVWVPHKLSEKNCLDRYSICDMLLKRNESSPFLKTLVTPPYSPDIAPSDYHLFLSLQNSLQGKAFIDLEGVKTHVANFFSSKPSKFYADGIFELPDRWTKVINNDGNYFTK